MSRRKLHRIALPRARGLIRRRPAATSIAERKRAAKHVAMRECGRRCVYCGDRLDPRAATLDHVHPRARGGGDELGNLVVACTRCNLAKGDMLPNEFFARWPAAGLNFIRYARSVHRALKRCARRAVSLAYARAA